MRVDAGGDVRVSVVVVVACDVAAGSGCGGSGGGHRAGDGNEIGAAAGNQLREDILEVSRDAGYRLFHGFFLFAFQRLRARKRCIRQGKTELQTLQFRQRNPAIMHPPTREFRL